MPRHPGQIVILRLAAFDLPAFRLQRDQRRPAPHSAEPERALRDGGVRLRLAPSVDQIPA